MNILDKWALTRVAKSYNLRDPNSFQKAFDDYFQLNVNNEDYIGAVFYAIDTWGLYFAKANFRVYKKTNDGIKEDKSHRVLFDNPNGYQVWWEIAYKIAGHFGLFGDAFLYKIRNKKNEVISYQLLLPSLVERKTSKRRPVDHYMYRDGTNEIQISRNDMIDLRYPNPNGDINGFPIVSSIADQSTVYKLQMAYAKKFFEQGGFLGLTFSTKQAMTPTNFRRTRKLLEEKYQGRDNAYSIGLFDSGLEPVKTAYGLKDMEFGGNRVLTREDIFAAFKVPKILVGLGESINRATAEASIYQFTSGVIDPVMDYIGQVLTNDYQKEYGVEYYVKADTLAPKDQEGLLAYYKAGLTQGWLTINEVRKSEDWNKLSGKLADIATINVGGALINVDDGKQIATESKPPIKVKNADYDLLWKKFDRRHNLMSRKFGRNVFGYLDDQQRRILEAVKDNFIVEEAFDLQNENLILYQLLEIDLYDIMREGYKYGNFMYGGDGQFSKTVMSGHFNTISANALLFNDTTQKSLREDVDKTVKNLKTRGESLVTTSVTGSLNAGLLRAMIDAGMTKKTWLTMRDGRVRSPDGSHSEDHLSMDGVTVGIDDVFTLPNRAGGMDRCMYPGDPSLSPENLVNDRCTIIGEF